LNVDLNDGFAVVFRGYTLVVSGERRVIAIDELENMLKWSWPIWGCNSKAGRERAILIAATIVAAIVAAGARPRAKSDSLLAQALSYVMDCKDIALVCVLLLRKRNVKKRKKFWVYPVTSQGLFKGKFYSLYEDL
jgi:hypothetical protein